jgi:hypothetical protein
MPVIAHVDLIWGITVGVHAAVGSDLPTFVGSGIGHEGGAVPDPGPTAGNTRYLCEDGTWSAAEDLAIGTPILGGSISGYVLTVSSSNTLAQVAPGPPGAILSSDGSRITSAKLKFGVIWI